MHQLRFRQVHLDFHTSPHIPAIGAAFDKKRWQETLRRAAVDSITTFATCHHGWAYYDTKIGKRHPNLGFDLLRAQYEASKEIDVNVPIYLTAGVNNMCSYDHPEWREISADGAYAGWVQKATEPGFHTMCFNTPYLDFLCEQIKEVVRLFPGCDGIFLDIISQSPCCCRWCMDSMREKGYNPELAQDRQRNAQEVLMEYYRRTTAAARIDNPDMPIFHNSGHVEPGETQKLKYFSHLELESLPTGGWGYDHFPMSAKYCKKLPLDFLGMTGKFHTTWGEFGGYKHPNALKYECAAMIAVGAKCSIGDQLHPSSQLDESTYSIIGEAYRDVAAKEAWCRDVSPVADIALLSSQCINTFGQRAADHTRDNAPDVGAGRALLEGQFLFDILDAEMDFSAYKMLIIPDNAKIGDALKVRLDAYLARGGKLLLTGESGLNADKTGFLFDIGASDHGAGESVPDYILPVEGLRPSFCCSPQVMYAASRRIKPTTGQSLGEVYDSYFNRTVAHFCSHQHTPNQPQPSGFACGVRKGNIVYLAHPVFTLYRGYGSVAYKEYIHAVIRSLLAEDCTLQSNLPSQARAHLMFQPAQRRQVLHLLYANKILRGGKMQLSGGNVRAAGEIEVIDELLPLCGTELSIKAACAPRAVTLEPQGQALPFTTDNGCVRLSVPSFTCHQMVVLQY